MNKVTHEHFGGNIILKKDPVHEESSFRAMIEEVHFSKYRYPGGGVTEDQTATNGGLDRMFGEPMNEDDPKYVLTIREALAFAEETGSGMTIVIPTFQFYDTVTDAFDYAGFNSYLSKLEDALLEHPGARILDFEIGNEYWAKISASDYGKIANAEIPLLEALSNRLASQMDGWEEPGIGIQAGVGWRAEQNESGRWHPTGTRESQEIVAEIDMENRALVDTIYQHAYPHAERGDYQREWTLDPVRAVQDSDGFGADLKVSISEFNIAKLSATGVHQGAEWVEEFAAHVDGGADEFFYWGLNYDWQSNKFYDSKFPWAESEGGEILTKATPMGQIYDLASTHLPGKSTLSDEDALDGIDVPDDFIVTGFRDASQKILFLHNNGDETATVDLSALPDGWHVSAHHLVNSDSPYTTRYDESIPDKLSNDQIADARGDMKVLSGDAAPDEMTLGEGESAVLILSAPGRGLVIEGAHNETDYRTDMVDDQIYGGTGGDILRGHVGDDLISGGAGRDVISAGKDNDTVFGGEGNDVIITGRGNNEAYGGRGDDLFVVSGGIEGDSSTITTGEGNDLILTSDDQHLTVTDMRDGDMIGFDGAFEDAEALQSATRSDGQDILVNLPGGGTVRIVGLAEKLDSFHKQVFDFQPSPESEGVSGANDEVETTKADLPLGEALLDGLSYEQLVEFYDVVDDVDGLDDETGLGSKYWLGLEDTIERTDVQPYQPAPYVEAVDEPEVPLIPPVDDEGYVPDPEQIDDDQDQASAAGGACFVATAAYGDRMHPDVVTLRRFRDCHLVRYSLGRRFVRFYWKLGPVLARHTAPDDLHGRFARLILASTTRVIRRYYGNI